MMPSNYRDFGPLLALADEIGVRVNVSVVRGPPDSSIWYLPQAEIEEIAAFFAGQDQQWRAALGLNRETWIRETGRVQQWAAADRGELVRVRNAGRVMGFNLSDRGATPDLASAGRDISFGGSGDDVFELAVGGNDEITWLSPELDDLVGAEADGRRDANEFFERLGGVFGPFTFTELARSPDRRDYRADFEGFVARSSLVVVRQPDRAANEVRIFVAFDRPVDRLVRADRAVEQPRPSAG